MFPWFQNQVEGLPSELLVARQASGSLQDMLGSETPHYSRFPVTSPQELGVARKAFGKKPRRKTIGVRDETGSLVWKQALAETHSCRTMTWGLLSHHSTQDQWKLFVSVAPKIKECGPQVIRKIALIGDQGLI